MSKSDRKTVFVSILNGAEDDFHHLSESLEEFTDDFRFIVTSKVVQLMDPLEMIETLRDLYIQEYDQSGMKRIHKMQQILDKTIDGLQSIEKELSVFNENFRNLEAATVKNTNVQDLNSYILQFTQLVSSGIGDLNTVNRGIERLAPGKGEKW